MSNIAVIIFSLMSGQKMIWFFMQMLMTRLQTIHLLWLCEWILSSLHGKCGIMALSSQNFEASFTTLTYEILNHIRVNCGVFAAKA